ncbi:MAG: hypothetical protein NTX91_02555 [candidate division SR1 bacterium]|nr:hypothetical protein [candidate division SR1 bacterium]
MSIIHTIKNLLIEITGNLRKLYPDCNIEISLDERSGLGEIFIGQPLNFHIAGVGLKGINFSMDTERQYLKGEDEVLDENEYNNVKKDIEDKAKIAIELSTKE